jgi:N-acetylglucosaminyldiphosphoundecaprenol N-acetyl-beta-D-mannosaminyltransferase
VFPGEEVLKDRVELFGVAMDALTMDQTVEEIDRRITAGRFTQHVVVNVAKLVQMQDDPELAAAVRACDIINIDGAGIVLGGRFLGLPIPERVAGIDLFEKLLAHGERAGRSVFLLGATPEVIERAVASIRSRYPHLRLAGFHHGYFWDDEASMVRQIRDSGAEMLFVGIGSPLKERFIDRWRDQFGVVFAMGVGGTFDVVAGKVRRAPKWMQRLGLEWLFRVIQEPRRMWRRYLVTNSRFAFMLLQEKWRRLRGRGRDQ